MMAIPKHVQIKENLMRKIENGDFVAGDRFYSEAELKKLFNVSGITVVRALNELVFEGYLVRYQGKGTFVSKARRHKIVRISDIEIKPEATSSTKVIEVKLIKDKRIAKELNIEEDEEIVYIKRVRYVEGVAVIVQYSYILKELINIEYVNTPDKFTSVYTRIKEDSAENLFKAESHEKLQIIFPSEEEVNNLLNLKKEEPTVKTTRHTYSFNKNIAEFVESYKRWDYFGIEIEPI